MGSFICNIPITSRYFPLKSGLMIFDGQLRLQGLTGLVKFDKQGFRSDFDLDILTSSYNGTIFFSFGQNKAK